MLKTERLLGFLKNELREDLHLRKKISDGWNNIGDSGEPEAIMNSRGKKKIMQDRKYNLRRFHSSSIIFK